MIPTWVVVHNFNPRALEADEKETLRTDVDPAVGEEVIVDPDVKGTYALDRGEISHPSGQ